MSEEADVWFCFVVQEDCDGWSSEWGGGVDLLSVAENSSYRA